MKRSDFMKNYYQTHLIFFSNTLIFIEIISIHIYFDTFTQSVNGRRVYFIYIISLLLINFTFGRHLSL